MSGKTDTQLTELTGDETARLAELEAVVEDGLENFVKTGTALMEIREAKLYREVSGTFEDYCRIKWRMTRRSADRLIGAASVLENLRPIGLTPTTESQARPLAALPAEQQREAWAEAVETAPDGKVTARHVAKVVAQRNMKTCRQCGKQWLADLGCCPYCDMTPDARIAGLEAQAKREREAFVDNAPLAALAKELGKTPKEEADTSPEKRWHQSFEKLYVLLNSIRDIGGVKKLCRDWSKSGRRESAKELREIVNELESWIKALEAV